MGIIVENIITGGVSGNHSSYSQNYTITRTTSRIFVACMSGYDDSGWDPVGHTSNPTITYNGVTMVNGASGGFGYVGTPERNYVYGIKYLLEKDLPSAGTYSFGIVYEGNVNKETNTCLFTLYNAEQADVGTGPNASNKNNATSISSAPNMTILNALVVEAVFNVASAMNPDYGETEIADISAGGNTRFAVYTKVVTVLGVQTYGVSYGTARDNGQAGCSFNPLQPKMSSIMT